MMLRIPNRAFSSPEFCPRSSFYSIFHWVESWIFVLYLVPKITDLDLQYKLYKNKKNQDYDIVFPRACKTKEWTPTPPPAMENENF